MTLSKRTTARLMRSALSMAIASSLAVLSPGANAWAQVAEAARARASAATTLGAAGAAKSAVPAASLPASALTPALFAPPLTLAPAALDSAVPSAPLSAVPVAAAPAAAATAAPESSAKGRLSEARRSLDSKDAEPEMVIGQLYDSSGFRPGRPYFTGVAAPPVEARRRYRLLQSHEKSILDYLDPRTEASRVAGPPDARIATALLENLKGVQAEKAALETSYPDISYHAAGRLGRLWMRFTGRGPAAVAAVAAAGAAVFSPFFTLPLVLVSLILHEIGHAKAAAALGDPTATRQGRASFNPLRWTTHIDPIMTIVLPLATYLTSGFIFGGAKPVPVDPSYFKDPVKGMAKVAFAGPAVNMVLAVAGSLAYAGAAAGGLGAVVLGALISFVFMNAVLAVFNLIPLRPLDGGHILAAFLPRAVSARIDSFHRRLGVFGLLPIVAIAMLGGGFIMGAALAITHFLIGASLGVTGVQLAGAALPAMAALGMLLGQFRAPAAPVASAAAESARPVDLVVLFSGEKALTKDLHLSQVDTAQLSYVQAYENAQRDLLAQISAVGLAPETLASYNATPLGAYRRINAATIRVDATRAAEFESMLRAAGHRVYANDRRKIITPVPVKPEDMDPGVRGAVTIEENLKITNAAAVIAAAAKRWGKPDMNPWQRLVRRIFHPFADKPAQPKIAVIDSGADVTHPLLKRVKEVKNVTSAANVDDIGHGTWVTSMLLAYAPWARNITHYKTFVDGGAPLDDILKALTAAANDGNHVISNSWGDGSGDPDSPDSRMVRAMAEEGHIMVFAAGNEGSAKNTIGAPAIVTYKDAATGAIRVVSVAASDRTKKVAYFSSRGPGSAKTKGIPGYPHRPDLLAIGYNTEGAWPAALGDADRTDPALGPLKAISGTSMSTPSVAGAIVLFMMMFGVDEKGGKLDAIVNALMGTLEKTGKNGPDDEGEGFINVGAAFHKLVEKFGTPKDAYRGPYVNRH